MRIRPIRTVGVCLSILVAFTLLSVTAMAPITPLSLESPIDNLVMDSNIQPTPMGVPTPEEPRVWVDGDFLISYDDDQNASAPDIAVAPPGSPWEGSIHAVWYEFNEDPLDPFDEIYYSMSEASERGLAWSNDEPSEDDRIISDASPVGKASNPGDARDPAIAIGPNGWIHVVWTEQYSDNTWEVHYTRSEDNGKTWKGFDDSDDTVVSVKSGSDGQWIDPPRIAITNSPIILHVVWSELDYNWENTEVFYSKSIDQGDTWSIERQISEPSAPGAPGAYQADIAVGGDNGKVLHVVWVQESQFTVTSEVFYAKSNNTGEDWFPEIPISYEFPDNKHAFRARVDAFNNWVHVVWDQAFFGKALDCEIYYSGSMNNGNSWSGMSGDTNISHSDGQEAWYPVLSTTSGGQEAHVIWQEIDETSGTWEIHYSMAINASISDDWTGRQKDEVLSHPDGQDVEYPAIALADINGEMTPQIVWSEIDTEGSGKADPNSEINTIPSTTFDVPIASTGWHFISSPLVQNDNSITIVLDDSWGMAVGVVWDKVCLFNSSDATDKWKTYATYKPSSLNDLQTLDHTMGFWIHITDVSDGYLTFGGDDTSSTSIDLKAGWNMVGYPANDDSSYNVSSLKSDTLATRVEGYDSGTPYNIKVLADNYVLKRGEAYWVLVSADATWDITW